MRFNEAAVIVAALLFEASVQMELKHLYSVLLKV
jgi:hypothetical protein